MPVFFFVLCFYWTLMGSFFFFFFLFFWKLPAATTSVAAGATVRPSVPFLAKWRPEVPYFPTQSSFSWWWSFKKKIIIEDSMSIHQEGSGNVPCFSFLFLTHTHTKKKGHGKRFQRSTFLFHWPRQFVLHSMKKVEWKATIQSWSHLPPISWRRRGKDGRVSISLRFLWNTLDPIFCLFVFFQSTDDSMNSKFFFFFPVFYEGFTDFRPISSSIGSVFRDFHTGRPLKGLVSSSFPRFFYDIFLSQLRPGNEWASFFFC